MHSLPFLTLSPAYEIMKSSLSFVTLRALSFSDSTIIGNDGKRALYSSYNNNINGALFEASWYKQNIK